MGVEQLAGDPESLSLKGLKYLKVAFFLRKRRIYFTFSTGSSLTMATGKGFSFCLS